TRRRIGNGFMGLGGFLSRGFPRNPLQTQAISTMSLSANSQDLFRTKRDDSLLFVARGTRERHLSGGFWMDESAAHRGPRYLELTRAALPAVLRFFSPRSQPVGLMAFDANGQ